MARTIGMASDAWAPMGLGDHLDPESAEFRNETDSGHGDDEGEWFAVAFDVRLADGHTYHILYHGSHGNDHSPFTGFNTWATIYRADHFGESDEFRAEVGRWESMPERLDNDDSIDTSTD